MTSKVGFEPTRRPKFSRILQPVVNQPRLPILVTCLSNLDARGGVEPPLSGSEPAFLPLEDRAINLYTIRCYVAGMP